MALPQSYRFRYYRMTTLHYHLQTRCICVSHTVHQNVFPFSTLLSFNYYSFDQNTDGNKGLSIKNPSTKVSSLLRDGPFQVVADLHPIVFQTIAQSNSNTTKVLHYCNIQYCNRRKVLHYCAIVLQQFCNSGQPKF